MKKACPKIKGFTLIELLVVITILAILSVIGFAVFNGVSKSANDGKRKSDVNEIAKAYELHYDGTYHELTATDFGGGKIPKRPEGGDYDGILSGDASGFQICAPLGDVPPSEHCSSPSSTCYCKKSSLGSFTTATSPPASTPASTPVSTSTPTPTPVPCANSNSLVGYWKFEDGGGLNVTDYSGNKDHGTWKNGTGTGNWTGGKVGVWAGQFNGISDDVATTNTISLASNRLTMAAWIKINGNGNSDGSENTIVRLNDPYDYDKLSWNKSNGKIVAQLDFIEGNAVTSLQSVTTLSIGDPWKHVAVVYDGVNVKLYLNGGEEGNAAQNRTLQPLESPVTIGNLVEAGRYFNGLIDDVRIYTRALSPAEISNLYNGGTGCNLP